MYTLFTTRICYHFKWYAKKREKYSELLLDSIDSSDSEYSDKN